MIKKKSIILATAFTIFTLGASFVGSMAWFMNTVTLSNINMEGDSKGAYFAYGNGTSGSPFGINTPRHLYNLAWLQYNGDFNKDVKNNSTGLDGADGILDKQYYFEIDNNLIGSLDMTGWTLPPIGTETYPFLGSFNGNNKTITNLTVSNPSSFSQKPISINYNDQTHERPEIVGFFGVVGKIGNTPSYTYTTSANAVTNVNLESITVKSETSKTLIGLAGGYVNGELSGVKVSGTSTIDVDGIAHTAKNTNLTNNLSDYGLVGYTTKKGDYGTFKQHLSEYYDNGVKGGGGSGTDFGDSIDMRNLYGRLKKVYNEDSYDNGSFTVETSSYPNGSVKKQKIENLSNKYSGYYTADHSYTFNKQYEGNQDIYFLYGDHSPVSGTETSNNYVFANKTVSGSEIKIKQVSSDTYYFYSGNNYLKVPQMTSTSVITLGTSDKTTNPAQATIFSVLITGSYYTFFFTEVFNNKTYYRELNGFTANSLRVAAQISLSNSDSYCFTLNGNAFKSVRQPNYYLAYTSNKFTLNTDSRNASNYNVNTGSTAYLSYDSNLGSCISVSSPSNAIKWFHINNKIFTLLNNNIYYLIGDTSKGVYLEDKITENDATSWTYSNNSISCVIDAVTYYLEVNPSIGLKTSAGNSITEESQGSASYPNQSYLSSTSITSSPIGINSFKNTYIPLSVSTSNIYSTVSSNTGYIVSGRTFENTSQPGYNSGDIRVSRYNMSNIRESMGQEAFDDSKMYIINATSNSDYKLITDSHNSGSSAPEGLSDVTGRKASTGLFRYDPWTDSRGVQHPGARASIGNTFTTDSANIYGLHFMNAAISESNTVVVPNAKINGTTYTQGLEMPKDCIDFFVKDPGYITFFAGTYFSGNNCFFSLNKIERNADNTISSITPIQTIYKDNNNNYYYNPQTTTGLTKVFDTAVLTNPTTFINNAVYYFEIPVGGDSEFALGSVRDKNGAYLMYLDISASGQYVVKDGASASFITTNKSGNSYPSGVDFDVVNAGNNGGDSIGIFISASSQGTVVFELSESNNITTIAVSAVEETTQIGSYAYRGSNYGTDFTVSGLSGDPPGQSPGGTRVLNINVLTTSDIEYDIRVTDILTNDSGAYDSSNSIYEIDRHDGNGFQPVSGATAAAKEAAIEALSSEIDLTEMRGLTVVATLQRDNEAAAPYSTTAEFVVTYDDENSSYKDKTVYIDIERNGTRIHITYIDDDYSLFISGTQYNEGDYYPAQA